MADLWLPGFERWELPGTPGQPYDELNDPKALLHSTEGTSIGGAVSAYRAYPPQLIVDPVRKRKVQHIPLNRAGYALWNEDADDSRCYQVEIVGYAAQSHLWPDEVLRWLGEELARPLHEYGGVPYVVVWKGFRRDGEMPYALAAASSPLRLTQAELDSFSGFLGHQHIPGDGHWDPGGLNVGRILAFAQNQEDDTVDLNDVKLLLSAEVMSQVDPETELPTDQLPYASLAWGVKYGKHYAEKSLWVGLRNEALLTEVLAHLRGEQVTNEGIAAALQPGLLASLNSLVGSVVAAQLEEWDGVELSDEARAEFAGDVVRKIGGLLTSVATGVEPH